MREGQAAQRSSAAAAQQHSAGASTVPCLDEGRAGSAAQRSTAQHSAAQHSTAQRFHRAGPTHLGGQVRGNHVEVECAARVAVCFLHQAQRVEGVGDVGDLLHGVCLNAM
jgi:hypothetical protein